MKITVFGTGYVGLVQGSVLAEVGHDVLCVDVDAAKVEGLKAGRIPIYEPGLEELVKKNHAEGRLNFTTDAAEGVAHAPIQFIAVGTPPDEDGSADLSYVLRVAATIAEHMAEPKVVVTKSTVPVGTADKVEAKIMEVLGRRQRSDLKFDVVSNPEFLKEGAAVADCMRPDRIVIGTASPEAEELLREVYAPFSRSHEKVIVMDVRSAELTKYAANCMLATKISFMNEMANLAERLGADVEAVRQGIGSDQRIGYHFIYPGAGYGGSCFPKDVKALIATAREIGFEPKLLQAVEDRNETQKTVIFEKIRAHYGGRLKGRTFALWGLAFKPQTDDMREAASRVVMEALFAAGARVQAFDPEAMEEAQRLYGDRADLMLCGTKEAALRDADALVVMTEWQAFRAPDFDLLKEKLKAPVVFDGRNLYEPARMARKGFAYYAIGRGLAEPPAQAAEFGRLKLRVLVTGAAGFVGFHVARMLIARGDAVTGFDNVNDYYDPRLKAARLAELARLDGDWRFLRADLADRAAVDAAFADRAGGPFDRVIHLAAQAGVRYSLENPLAYVESNLTGFTHVLEACRHARTPHLVFASTSSVYGGNTTMPFGEGQGVDHPLQFYAATKRANELMAHAYAHLFALPCTALRFFTVYGPWGRPDMAPMLFASAIAEGRPIRLFNAGRHSRDFTYVDDIAEGVIRAADLVATPDPAWDPARPDPGTSSAPFRIYNIGNGRPVELLDFIAALERELGREAIREPLPPQPGDVPDTFADVSRLEAATGWRPRTPVAEGVREFVAWFRAWQAAPARS